MNSNTPKSDLGNHLNTEQSLDTLAELAGIKVPHQYRSMVGAHLRNAAAMADIIYNAPIDAQKYESAAVFTPAELDNQTGIPCDKPNGTLADKDSD